MREQFDPSDPAEQMADSIRKGIAEMFVQVSSRKGFRDLSSIDQVQAFMGGAMTAIVGVCFAHIDRAGRDAMVEALRDYLPAAREQAEAIIANGQN